MNVWFQCPLPMQLAIIVFVSVLLTPALNWMIYNAAMMPLPISPYFRSRFKAVIDSHCADVASARTLQNQLHRPPLLSYLPVIGWLYLRELSAIFGPRFWLRPMLLELFFPIFLAWLYWYELTGGLLPAGNAELLAADLTSSASTALQSNLLLQFLSHAILCIWMCIASCIDLDEQTIPDLITIPGTLLGLLFTTAALTFADPMLLTINPVVQRELWIPMIESDDQIKTALSLVSLRWTSPWTREMSFDKSYAILTYTIAAWSLWCFALSERRWRRRQPWRKNLRVFFARLRRSESSKFLLAMWFVGVCTIAIAFNYFSNDRWSVYCTSILGLMIGGSIVWALRLVANYAIGFEALGFGDVTLMCMVGAYVGWQPTWISLFMGSVIALPIVLYQYFRFGDNRIPFGPYLCAGVLAVLLFWNAVWNNYLQEMIYVLGWMLMAFIVVMVIFTGVLLKIWLWIKKLLHLESGS